MALRRPYSMQSPFSNDVVGKTIIFHPFTFFFSLPLSPFPPLNAQKNSLIRETSRCFSLMRTLMDDQIAEAKFRSCSHCSNPIPMPALLAYEETTKMKFTLRFFSSDAIGEKMRDVLRTEKKTNR